MSTSQTGHSDFDVELADKKKIVDTMLERLLAEEKQIEPSLMEAMRYTTESPGKRIRAAVVMWCCQAVGGSINDNARIAAAAIEMVHTYSLIHDDLPAMDNDDMRRGKPACHKKFDEATAILAGDALLTFAFQILSDRIDEPATAAALIGELESPEDKRKQAASRIHSHEQNGKDVSCRCCYGSDLRRRRPQAI
jgi:geranylgeranyl pyrophosphate synthase